MSRGRFQLGQDLVAYVLCTDAADRPAAPDAFPRVAVYSASGHHVLDVPMPIVERGIVTGLFTVRIFLDGSFSTGNYQMVFRWKVGSHHGGEVQFFEILPGGDISGQVIALYDYPRPSADHLIQQRTDGSIRKGRNPRRAS